MAYCSAVAAVVTTTSINVGRPGTAIFDGITLVSGQRVLLTAQSTPSQNGVWTFSGSSTAMSRPGTGDPFAHGATLDYAIVIPVTGGPNGGLTWGGSEWWLSSPTSGAVTVDTTPLTFIRRNARPVQARLASAANVSLSSGGPGQYIDSSNVTDGSMTHGATSATLSCPTSQPFSSGSVGAAITVIGAGANGSNLAATISTYVSPSVVTLSTGCGTSVTNATVQWSGNTVTDGCMATSASSSTLTCPTSQPFTSADANKSITVNGAGSSGSALTTTIQSVISASVVTLATGCSTSVTQVSVQWGPALELGDVVLLTGQTSGNGPIDNGLYFWNGSSSAMTRTPDPVYPNIEVLISEGNTLAHGRYKLVTQGPVTIGTSALTFARQNDFNVRDFGATGNGATDDTAAIQTAINAAGQVSGAIVFFPQGTYLISATLIIRSNLSLRGVNSGYSDAPATGSMIAKTTVGDGLLVSRGINGSGGTSAVHIEDLQILCQASAIENVPQWQPSTAHSVGDIVRPAAAFSTITTSGTWTQPSVGGYQTLTVSSTWWMYVGLTVSLYPSEDIYTVSSVSGNTVTLQNQSTIGGVTGGPPTYNNPPSTTVFQNSWTPAQGNVSAVAITSYYHPAFGPNNLALSPRLLKCTAVTGNAQTAAYPALGSTTTSGNPGPLGILTPPTTGTNLNVTLGPPVSITGTPNTTVIAGSSPVDIQIPSGGTTFSYSTNRTTWISGGSFTPNSSHSLGSTGYTVNFGPGTYFPGIYRTPSFLWSLAIGSSIQDNNVTWEVIDAGAGVDVVGGTVSMERCILQQWNTCVILDQCEDVYIRNCVFNAATNQSTMTWGTSWGIGIWIVNDSSHLLGTTGAVAMVSQLTNLIHVSDCNIPANGASVLDDGGLEHYFYNMDCEGPMTAFVLGNPVAFYLNGGDFECNKDLRMVGGAFFYCNAGSGGAGGPITIENIVGGTAPMIDCTGWQAGLSAQGLTVRNCAVNSNYAVVRGASQVGGLTYQNNWGPPGGPRTNNVLTVVDSSNVNGLITSGFGPSFPIGAGTFGLALGSYAGSSGGMPNAELDVAGTLALRGFRFSDVTESRARGLLRRWLDSVAAEADDHVKVAFAIEGHQSGALHVHALVAFPDGAALVTPGRGHDLWR
jgi:hypothetical protein